MATSYAGQIGSPLYGNTNPAPQAGQGPYGSVPGPTPLPPSLYQQALTQVPGLGQNAATASNATQSLLTGQVSPDTESYIDRLIAAKGVSSGVPGSPFNTADLVKSLGLTSEQLVTSGLDEFDRLLSTVGGLQLNPALQADITQSNALLASAPNPKAAAKKELQTLTDFYNRFGAGPSGGTGTFTSTNLLGPRATLPSYPTNAAFGGAPGIGLPTGSPDAVYFGGPGFGPTTSTPVDPYTNWASSTFGGANYLGVPGVNPTGASGTEDQQSWESLVGDIFPEIIASNQ